MANRSDGERRLVVSVMQHFGRIWVDEVGADGLSDVFAEDLIYKRQAGPTLNGIAEVKQYLRNSSNHSTTDLFFVPLPELYRKLSSGHWIVKFRFSPRKRDARFAPCEWTAVIGLKKNDGRIAYFDEIGAWKTLLKGRESTREMAEKRGRKIARRRGKWCNGKTREAFEETSHYWG